MKKAVMLFLVLCLALITFSCPGGGGGGGRRISFPSGLRGQSYKDNADNVINFNAEKVTVNSTEYDVVEVIMNQDTSIKIVLSGTGNYIKVLNDQITDVYIGGNKLGNGGWQQKLEE